MRLLSILYISLLVGGSKAYAQEQVDTAEMTRIGRNARRDEIYFEAQKAKQKNDDEQAISLFEQYAAKRPEVSATQYELARLYYSEKKNEKALTAIKKAIELDPGNKWYKEEYAVILAEKGSFAEAADQVAALADSDGDGQTYAIMAAEYYQRAQKYKEAIKYLDKALARSSADAEILQEKKIGLYLNLNDVNKAADVAREMISKDPKNGANYKLLGDIYDNNNMPAKAADVYNNVKKQLPNDPSIQMGMAAHALKTGDTAKYKIYVTQAITNNTLEADDQVDMLRKYVQTFPDEQTSIKEGMPIIRELVAQHPDDAPILGFYGDFLEGINQHDSAIVYYKRSLVIKPSDFDGWRKLLSNLTEKKDADTLVKYSEKAMRLFPNQALVSYFNGIGHYNKKEYMPAIKAINRAIEIQPENNRPVMAAMYSMLGDIYHTIKEDNKSDDAFQKALAMEPNDATVLNNYAYYLSERGAKLDSAEKMSKKSLELRPDEGTFLDTYGWILYKRGSYEKAREYIQKAIDKAGEHADATLYEHLGDIYYKLNNKEKAVESWRTAKQKGGGDPQLDKKINDGKLYE